MIKIFATPVMGFRIMKLVVESEPVLDATGYDPCQNSTSYSNNPISDDVPAQSNSQTVQNQDDKN
jgi:hypothetical protein